MDLLAAKSLSISKLLALAPPGTIDPTPHLYDSTMFALSGLMAVAVVAHGMVRPLPLLSAAELAAIAKAEAAKEVVITEAVKEAVVVEVQGREVHEGDRLVKK